MSTSKPRTYHHGALGPALLDAADTLIEEVGTGALSLREVARRAGVSATACYRHFATKDALLAALAGRGFDQFGVAMNAATTDAAQRNVDPFAAMGVAYVLFAIARPGRFRLMFGPSIVDRRQHPDLKARADIAFARLQQVASSRARAGFAPVANTDQITVPGSQSWNVSAIAGWSLVHGLSQLIIDGVLPAEHAEVLALAVTSRRG